MKKFLLREFGVFVCAVIVVVLFFVFVRSAFAADAEGCVPVNETIGKFLNDERTARAVSLEGEQIARAVKFFNAFPPASEESFSTVALFETKRGTGILLFGNDGKFCQALAVGDEAQWDVVKNYILGAEPNAASQR